MKFNNHNTDAHTHSNYTLDKMAIRAIAMAGFLFLVACGEVESDTPVQSAITAAADATHSEATIKSIDLDLSTTAIDKQTFLGNDTKVASESAPCPFLSDETALATVKTDWVLQRRDTSAERCYWSKNLGFSVKVTVEPLATAKPLAERVYNLESPPVLKTQAEPGNKATVLYDTVWGNERPYALAFEQDQNLVMITVTGLNTDADRLTATAMEVSEKLTNPSAQETSSESSQVTSGPFDLCSTWSESELSALMESPVQMTTGKQDCIWESMSGENLQQIRVTIYDGKYYPWDSLLEQGAIDIPGVGERALMEQKRKKGQMPGHVLMNALYDEKLVTITVTDTITDYQAVALALSKNIDSRFN